MEGIRMYLCGTEAELRPVNGFNYLKNLKAARDFAAENDSMSEAETLAFWAGMLSDSAYDGEDKLFSSLSDVMEKLTAQEIASAAQDIFYKVALPKIEDERDENNAAQNGKAPAARGIGGGAAGIGRGGSGAADIYGEPVSGGRTALGDMPRDRKSKKEITLSFGRGKGGGISGGAAETGTGSFGRKERSDVRISTAEELSEFFERDSRRYDRTY